ncbi:RHS repeat domain-containing protein [Treponema pedis]|uniref:Teneurin-like YD-shell domain-containing protein n=2 Tax=Treponema pedis TaxID=409322 RepID=S5ZV34_9SPIR|nr:RHS repeat-associated core domain-containing protein [Treponema pedis]AGT44075.1 hypothetical protein TPE_1580 [Treponema pedis str. T A4]
MKSNYLVRQLNYLTRTAIEREQKQFIKIAFAVHLSAVISAERYRSDSGALKSAVPILVYFYIMMINKYRQSAAQSCLRKKLSLSEIPTDRTFGNRRSRYKEPSKNKAEAYLVYVEHLFLRSDAGDARIFSKEMTHTDNHGDNDEQREKRYYYHSDHLGSAQFVTDWKGRQYEHIEYTPYGELWVEETAPGIDKLPFRFTGKELDEETGLYYYGARYLDPKYSRWLSGDPALNDYMAGSSVGEGGIYNTVNFNVYHYGGNNPIKYVDPTGNDHIAGNQYTGGTLDWYFKMQNLNQSNNKHSADQNLLENRVIMGTNNIPDYGPCFIMSLFGIAQTRTGKNMTAEQVTTGIGYLIENDIVGMEKNKEYLVKNAIAIINYALNILGSYEQALKAKNANEAQASTVKTEKNTYGYGHFGEGDSEGKLVWDPLGEITIINIDRIDYFKFQTKEIKE